jgi:CYTH domain-containing protein
MAIKKFQTEKELGFRPFILPSSKIAPVKQLFAGYEIEKKFILLTLEKDHTKNQNGQTLYNEVLENGTKIRQGYIKDIPKAIQLIKKLGIKLNPEFKPNTIRLRQYGLKYILTLKDKKETKKREVEFELSRAEFNKHWAMTKGARVEKKRLEKKIKGHLFELDAFTDRFLLLAECEVTDEKLLEKVPKLGMDVTNNSAWANKNLSK